MEAEIRSPAPVVGPIATGPETAAPDAEPAAGPETSVAAPVAPENGPYRAGSRWGEQLPSCSRPATGAPAAAPDAKLLRVLARAFEGLSPEQREEKWEALKSALAAQPPATAPARSRQPVAKDAGADLPELPGYRAARIRIGPEPLSEHNTIHARRHYGFICAGSSHVDADLNPRGPFAAVGSFSVGSRRARSIHDSGNTLAGSSDGNSSTRVRAADSVLNHAKQAIEIEDIDVRVAAVERAAELSKQLR